MKLARPCRLLLCGATGRTGSRVAALARADRRFLLAGEISGVNAAAFGPALKGAEVVVDFSTAAAVPGHAEAAARAGVASVIGVTGLSPRALARLRALSKRAAILLSPNMSPGANFLIALAARAAAALPGYDAGVFEIHHRLKKDRPSGTALRLAAAAGKSVPIESLRLGDFVGEHTLTLAGPGESLSLSHRAVSRDVFAAGALRAALWIRGRRPGLYEMADALGIR